MPKVSGVQTRTVSGLLLGSLGKKCHLDVASVENCREYYKGEGGGFPRVRAVDCSLGVSGKCVIWMWLRWRTTENTIRGKVVASPEFGLWTAPWESRENVSFGCGFGGELQKIL
jgi:hypothetical protein